MMQLKILQKLKMDGLLDLIEIKVNISMHYKYKMLVNILKLVQLEDCGEHLIVFYQLYLKEDV